MDRSDIEELNRKANARLAVRYAMDIFNCKTVEELKELCSGIIDAINYLNN